MLDVQLATTEAIADWIELSLLVSGSGQLGRDALDELAAAELGVSPATVSMGIAVMAKRGQVLSGVYPFRASDLAVRRVEGPLLYVYSALLLLTPGSVARQLDGNVVTPEMSELLELITEHALANFWGQGGNALRFGYPSAHGRPEQFDKAVKWLAEHMGLEPGRGYRPPLRKDGGVDVVAWRPFADQRPGFPVALAQCTMQEATFTKTTDIDLRLWSSWLAMDTDPLSLLVIPGTIRPTGPDWRQLSTVVMLIERMRILDLLSRAEPPRITSPWVDRRLTELVESLGAAER